MNDVDTTIPPESDPNHTRPPHPATSTPPTITSTPHPINHAPPPPESELKEEGIFHPERMPRVEPTGPQDVDSAAPRHPSPVGSTTSTICVAAPPARPPPGRSFLWPTKSTHSRGRVSNPPGNPAMARGRSCHPILWSRLPIAQGQHNNKAQQSETSVSCPHTTLEVGLGVRSYAACSSSGLYIPHRWKNLWSLPSTIYTEQGSKSSTGCGQMLQCPSKHAVGWS